MMGSEFASCFLVVAIITFSNVGGLGAGGGILIFLMMSIFQFNAKNDIALQNACNIAGSVTRYVVSLREGHPLREGKGTLVDYNLVSLMMPGAVVGVSLGTIANAILPGPLILVFFISCVGFSAYTGVRKYILLRKVEQGNVPLAHSQLSTTGPVPKIVDDPTPSEGVKDIESAPVELAMYEGG